MNDFQKTRVGQKFLRDISRIASALERIASALEKEKNESAQEEGSGGQ